MCNQTKIKDKKEKKKKKEARKEERVQSYRDFYCPLRRTKLTVQYAIAATHIAGISGDPQPKTASPALSFKCNKE